MQYRYTGKKEKKKEGMTRKKTKKEEWSREDAQTQD